MVAMNTRIDHHLTGLPRSSSPIGTLLGVWAHPDDEAYLSAGLMALARAAGDRVVVATATRGERGTDDPERCPPELLGRIREHETASSLAALDVSEHYWLGHLDGDLDRVPVARAVRQVRRLIEQIQPDTVVTFGPEGMTGHSDHQAVSDWTTSAWLELGQPCRLWYATVTPEFHDRWGEVNQEIGFWFDGATPPSDPSAELAFAVHCDDELLDLKFSALRAHESQTAGLIRRLGPDRYRRWWSTESFADAARKQVLSAVA
jgi:LmbE family N-acetylglucosaminyl deacetylase